MFSAWGRSKMVSLGAVTDKEIAFTAAKALRTQISSIEGRTSKLGMLVYLLGMALDEAEFQSNLTEEVIVHPADWAYSERDF